jgi:hypothetical protein
MNKVAKILGAVAAAGVIAAGSSAFTAGGLSTTAGADADNFIGGQVSQTITGATLKSVAYTNDPTSATPSITAVTLVFDEDLTGRPVTISLDGGATTVFPCVLDEYDTDSTVICTTAGAAKSGLANIDIRVVA